jgi:ABC-type Fe3+-hydroxamate transport system substrate-binding protein
MVIAGMLGALVLVSGFATAAYLCDRWAAFGGHVHSRATSVALQATGAARSDPACGLLHVPKRVASVALASDTILLRLLGAERLSAVSWVVDWPEYSPHAGQVPTRLPRLGGDPEAVIALAPDLAVISDHPAPGFGQALRAAGIATLELAAPQSLTAIIDDVARIGTCVGTPTAANQWSAELSARLRRVAERAARRRKWRVLVIDSGLAQGLGTLVDDLLRHLHASNPARETGLQGGVTLDAERLLAWCPEVLFVAVTGAFVPDARAELAQIPGYELLRGSQDFAPRRVVGISRRELGAVSPLALDALEAMDRVLEDLEP